MGSLDGHKAIVTGGASGIGAAVCRIFTEEGATVAVLDRRIEGVDGIVFECNVADPAAVNAAVEAAVAALGGVTDLVNNAGTGMNKPLHEYTDADWARLIGVNLTGTFNCMRAVLPLLVAAGGGSIVNNASVNAVRPLSGEGPYSAAKAGVVNLAMTAALEYAPTVRVNCVSPGMIATPLTALVTSNPAWLAAAEKGTPLQRVGSADDIAKVIAFLCSDAAAYITGQNFVIDGGATLPNAQAETLIATIMSSL